MTERYMPFDAGAGANAYEADWSQMARLWLASGVFPTAPFTLAGAPLQVYGDSTGMQVKVRNGVGAVRGHYYHTTAELTKTIAAADGTNPRIDRVVLRLDSSANTITVAVLAGTPAASPSAPALTQTEGATWEVSLAQVAVAAGASTIAAGNVTDERFLARSADTAPRGLITAPVLRTTDITSSATAQISTNGLETASVYVPASRTLAIEFSARGFRNSNGSASVDIGLFSVTGGAATQRGGAICYIPDTPVTTQHSPCRAVVSSLAAGVYTFRAGFWTPVGGGGAITSTLSAQSDEPAILTVIDLGAV